MDSKYTILISDEGEWFVKLLQPSGIWAGIVYSYQDATIEDAESGNPKLKYSWQCHYIPPESKDILTKADDSVKNILERLLGQILYDILEQHQDQLKKDEQSGKIVLDFSEIAKKITKEKDTTNAD